MTLNLFGTLASILLDDTRQRPFQDIANASSEDFPPLNDTEGYVKNTDEIPIDPLQGTIGEVGPAGGVALSPGH